MGRMERRNQQAAECRKLWHESQSPSRRAFRLLLTYTALLTSPIWILPFSVFIIVTECKSGHKESHAVFIHGYKFPWED